VHLCLGQLVEQHRDWREEIVARLGAIGSTSNGRIAALAAARPLELLPAGTLDDREVIGFFDARIAFLVGRVRSGLGALGDSNEVTRDLLAEIAGWLEMQSFFLRAHLSQRAHPTGPLLRPVARRSSRLS
jgi:DNA-binding ferritin-like protein